MELRSARVVRIDSQLREVLSRHLVCSLSEPLPCYASISLVETHPNLRNARVYFRLVGDEQGVNEAKRILNAEKAQFQKTVAREMPMRFCPVLHFEYGVARGEDSEIDRLLSQINKPFVFED